MSVDGKHPDISTIGQMDILLGKKREIRIRAVRNSGPYRHHAETGNVRGDPGSRRAAGRPNVLWGSRTRRSPTRKIAG